MSDKRRACFQGDWDEISASKLLAAPAVQEHGIRLDDVMRALDRINPHQREALMLATVGDMSHEEAAGVMGVAAGTMKSRVSRAREALNHQLSESRQPQDVVHIRKPATVIAAGGETSRSAAC